MVVHYVKEHIILIALLRNAQPLSDYRYAVLSSCHFAILHGVQHVLLATVPQMFRPSCLVLLAPHSLGSVMVALPIKLIGTVCTKL
jgi:hypothetical protein